MQKNLYPGQRKIQYNIITELVDNIYSLTCESDPTDIPAAAFKMDTEPALDAAQHSAVSLNSDYSRIKQNRMDPKLGTYTVAALQNDAKKINNYTVITTKHSRKSV